MNVVADLFPFVTEDAVLAPLEIAFHQVAEEAVQLDAGVIRPGEATAAQAAGGHSEIAPIFLDLDVGRHLGGAEQGMLRLIDREGLRNAVRESWIAVIPARRELLHVDK